MHASPLLNYRWRVAAESLLLYCQLSFSCFLAYNLVQPWKDPISIDGLVSENSIPRSQAQDKAHHIPADVLQVYIQVIIHVMTRTMASNFNL
jgi:hypothetical protein